MFERFLLMDNNIYEDIRLQLHNLFDLISLIKSQEFYMDCILGDEFYNDDVNDESNYAIIGKRLVEFFKKEETGKLTEADLPVIMLSKITNLIKLAIEVDLESSGEYMDSDGSLINVEKDLEDIFFNIEDQSELNERVNDFIDFHINRLMHSGANEFVVHDFNIEDWVILGDKKIGLYLDSSVYHHYGCWIPDKYLKHLSLPIDLTNFSQLNVELFFKKKAYSGTLNKDQDKFILYWDNLLRRRINKKFPSEFSEDENFNPSQRVLMSFYYNENFENNFIKIDFKLVYR
jgi:hypothetical protein